MMVYMHIDKRVEKGLFQTPVEISFAAVELNGEYIVSHFRCWPLYHYIIEAGTFHGDAMRSIS